MSQGHIRIIGGAWRGRKLKVPDVLNLRPTPNRIRETVFNWLSPVIAGSHCLDAFAGSGALGFEALSRGAANVVMVDDSLEVVTTLQQEAIQLKTKQADIYQAHLPFQLKPPEKPFDIVFLDPPFQQDLLFPTCHYLEENGFLAKRAYIYLEASEMVTDNTLPSHWQLLKNKKAGQVAYHLVLREV